MDRAFAQAYGCGYERLVSWSDLIDRINVFPVADSDTGRNLKISLTPLRTIVGSVQETVTRLMTCATGNSGNIAARFFSGFLEAGTSGELAAAAAKGSAGAWQSVAAPRQGTMLTIFERLAGELSGKDTLDTRVAGDVIDTLKQAVLDTPDLLPDLKDAQVVDAGALAMFIFFEGFFKSLFDIPSGYVPITVFLAGKLTVSSSYDAAPDGCYCVDTLVEMADYVSPEALQTIRSVGRSVVVIPQDSRVKIHLHTDDPEAVMDHLKSLGNIVSWKKGMTRQTGHARRKPSAGTVHIMTDAAGSVTRDDSETLGMTLLDSYLVFDDKSVPETLFPPSSLYEAMRNGRRVTTAQTSMFERHQAYSSTMAQHKQIVYLCVGSVFTGNYDTAVQWKKANDPDNRFRIVDTTAASGRLGVIALKVAEYAKQSGDIDAVVDFAEKLVDKCMEFIFLDCLKYLVAGGRLSETGGFFGDLLRLKPVISPTRRGAVKVGVVLSREGQVRFALETLTHYLAPKKSGFILLEYSDNRNWVEDTVLPEIKQRFPLADIMLQPLSLTSGTHMGPGTWGVAFLPE